MNHANVVYLKHFRLKKSLSNYIDRLVKNSDVIDSLHLQQIYSQLSSKEIDRLEYIAESEYLSFDAKKILLVKSLKSNSWKFKFPGITNSYSNIPAVLCIANEIERILLERKKKDPKLKFIKTLVEDQTWFSSVLCAIEEDVAAIEHFIRAYQGAVFAEEDIMRLNHLKVRLISAHRTFKTLHSK